MFSFYIENPGIKKPRYLSIPGFQVLMPGNDLLSHGETPHYHRRSSISLLSSEWDQVGLERYGCQANWLGLYFGDSLLISTATKLFGDT